MYKNPIVQVSLDFRSYTLSQTIFNDLKKDLQLNVAIHRKKIASFIENEVS